MVELVPHLLDERPLQRQINRISLAFHAVPIAHPKPRHETTSRAHHGRRTLHEASLQKRQPRPRSNHTPVPRQSSRRLHEQNRNAPVGTLREASARRTRGIPGRHNTPAPLTQIHHEHLTRPLVVRHAICPARREDGVIRIQIAHRRAVVV